MKPFRAPSPGMLLVALLGGAFFLGACADGSSDPLALRSVSIAVNATYTDAAAASAIRADIDRARAFVVRPSTGDTIAQDIQDVTPDQESVEFVLDVELLSRQEQLTVGVEQLVGPLVAFGGETSLLADARQPVNESPPIELAPVAPALIVEPDFIGFTVQAGSDASARAFEIRNEGGNALPWVATPDQPWLEASPASGVVEPGETASVSVSVSSSTLTVGTYAGIITITADETLDSPQEVGVGLSVTPPAGTAITVLGSGTGSGTVQSVPPGIDCTIVAGQTSGTCVSGAFAPGAQIALTATADSASSFQGWSGSCTGSAACQVTMDQSRTVTAAFEADPEMAVSPIGLAFSALAGTSPQPAMVFVSNVGGGTISWQANSATQWLDVNPASGTLGAGEVDTLFATVDSDTLAIGSYSDLIVVFDPLVGNSPQTVPVVLNVGQGPLIAVSPSNFAFSTLETTDPSPQTLTVKNTGAVDLDWSAATASSWLGLSATSGSVPPGDSTLLSVIVSSSMLAPGQYSDTITVTDPLAINSPQQVVVTLDVRQLPSIGVSTSNLAFSTLQGRDPAPQTFVIHNTGGDTLRWGGANQEAWLALSPTSGTLAAGDSAVVTATVSSAALVIGTYHDTVTVSDPAASNDPVTVAVRLDIGQGPLIGISPASLAYSTFQGSSPAVQTFKVTNTGGDTLNWSASSSASWVSANPSAGALAAGDSVLVTVTVVSDTLSPGAYAATIDVVDPGAINSPQPVSITLDVVQPTIGTSPSSLSFSTLQGQNPPSQTLTLTNTGTGTLNWTGATSDPSVALSVTSGSLPASMSANLTVSVTSDMLAPGTYSSWVVFTDPNASNSPDSVAVTLTVSPAAMIGTAPTSLSFTTPEGQDPPAQVLAITNVGTGTLNWSAAGADPFVGLSPTSGSLGAGLTDNVTVSIDAMGLTANTYSSWIVITDPNALNSPDSVPVTLVVTPAPAIGTSPSSLVFTTQQGQDPATQVVTITNVGTGTLNWSAAGADPFVGLSPTSGSLGAGLTDNVTVSIDVGGLAPNTYTSWMVVSDPNAINSPDSVAITVEVQSPEPTATIIQPANGAQFTVGTNIQFQGSATDVQDGTLTGSSLVWTYDVYGGFQGSIGTGQQVSKVATPLSTFGAGEYTVVLTATDSDGNVSADSVSISIVNNPNEAPAVSGGTIVAKDDTSLDVDYTSSIDTKGAWTEVWVEYGTTTGLGSVTARTLLPPNSSLTGIQWQPTGLQPFTRYYFRAVASGVGGVTQGPIEDVATTSPIVITAPDTLPDATMGVAYSVQLTATGGNPDASPLYVWSPGDALPPGLSLSSDGVISGTPTITGTRTFAVLVESMDALGFGNSAAKIVTITIN